MREKSLIVGASSGVGRALCYALADLGQDLFIISSDPRDLKALKADIELKFDVGVSFEAIDLSSFSETKYYQQIKPIIRKINNFFYIAGYSDINIDRGPVDDKFLNRIYEINQLSCIRLINLLMKENFSGRIRNIVGVGSIATIRARKKNMAYSTAKMAIEHYFMCCRHLFANQSDTFVQFYRLGYVKTQLTFGQNLPLPAANPSYVAKIIVSNLGKDTGIKYIPYWWNLVALIMRLIPWKLYRKLDF